MWSRSVPVRSLAIACAGGCLLALLGCSAGEHAQRFLQARRDEPIPVVEVKLPPPPELVARAAAAAQPEEQPPSGQPVAHSDAPAATAGEPPAPDQPEPPELFAIAREVIVRQRPSHGAAKIGYLRLGASVRRGSEPESHAGCSGGWYRVMPEGYVCAGTAAALDAAHPALGMVSMPDRGQALPYAYGRAAVPPPRYTRLPAPSSAAPRASLKGWADVENTVLPASLLEGRPLPRPHGYALAGDQSLAGQTPPNSGFAFLAVFESEQRRLGLSTDFELLPLERLERIRPSSFHGISLNEGGLPVAFVKSRSAWLYSGEPSKGLTAAQKLGYREAVALTGESVRFAGVTYLRTRAGEWLKDEHLVRIDPLRERPSFALGKRSWLHVSILQQSLVAYEGETPVYATLVSTGKDGLGDPETTHSTVRGSFLVHTKHVTTTMQGDEEDDAFLLSDVPYVQYFEEGYALHAAYWHDSFGTPRSHGCVNLAPLDARWLFHWTEPPVPRAWHGALSLREGSVIHITP